MQKEVKCPQCGGNRFKELENNTCKCIYCGTTFIHKETTENSNGGSSGYSAQVNTTTNENTRENVRPVYDNVIYYGGKSKSTALVICFFLGSLGGHKFYLGNTGLGILYLIFCWTWIPTFLSLIEFIVMLCMSEREFNQKYNT